jgi:hypothetical protein
MVEQGVSRVVPVDFRGLVLNWDALMCIKYN